MTSAILVHVISTQLFRCRRKFGTRSEYESSPGPDLAAATEFPRK